MFDLLREINQTLRNNKLRTGLTGGAVAWGIFMLIILLGAARGVTNAVKENREGRTFNIITLWPGYTSKPHAGFKEGRLVELREDDGTILRQQLGNVSDITTYASIDTARISTSRDYIGGGFNAVFPDALQREYIELRSGRFINRHDITDARRVIVLHEKNARLLFGSEEKALGGTVKCMNLAWTVVGIYSHYWRTKSYVPYSTYKALTGNNDKAKQLDVTVEGLKTEDEGTAAEDAIRGVLARRHNFAADDRSALWSWNQFNQYLRNQTGDTILNLATWILGIFTLLTGIVGVSNIMFVSVRERTHEIGIRRAIGARPRSILTQILAESIAITAIFGYIGIFLGMVVLQIMDALIGDVEGFRNPTVDISIALEVTLALIVAGALAGLFPALKAIKVKPVEALRDE